MLTLVTTLGLGSMLAALNIKYRDFRYIIPFFVQFLLFLTPVIYPVTIIKNQTVQFILQLNPLAGAIDLSNVSIADRNAFLARVGLGPAADKLREGAHIVAIGVTSATLPAGAVRIAPTHTVRSEHNIGYIFTLTFRP